MTFLLRTGELNRSIAVLDIYISCTFCLDVHEKKISALVSRSVIFVPMTERERILYEFIKGRGLPIGTVRTHGGKKVIKVADGKWKRYGSEHGAKQGRQVKEKMRGRKGSRPAKGVPQTSFVLFNRKHQRKVKSYLFKGNLGHYNGEKGIPKSGKVIVVDFKRRKVIGEAHTKKGVQKLLKLHSGDTKVMPLAYVPQRGRPVNKKTYRPRTA